MKNVKDIINHCVDCKLCIKECNMLKEYCNSPKKLFKNILENEQNYSIIPYSCSLCRACETVCPKELKISKAFMELRKEVAKKNNGKSPLKGHRAIHMHQNLSFSNTFNKILLPEGIEKIDKVFMPGCSLCSYDPDLVFKTHKYLNEKLNGCGLLIGCCGRPTESIGEEDKFKKKYEKLQKMIDISGAKEVITACQSCFLTIGENSPELKVKSLWNVLNEVGIPDNSLNIGRNSDIVFTIHDSCPTRYEKEIHDSIREIMKKLGYKFEEMEHNREKTRCCGAGGMVPSVNPSIAIKNMKDTAFEAKNEYVVTYCASCRQSMTVGGKKSLHILDLIFSHKWNRNSKIPKTLGTLKSWKNRLKVVKKIKGF